MYDFLYTRLHLAMNSSDVDSTAECDTEQQAGTLLCFVVCPFVSPCMLFTIVCILNNKDCENSLPFPNQWVVITSE